jgi:hypothetical protein
MAELQTVDRRSFLKLSGLATGIVLSGGAVVVGSVGLRPAGVAAASQAQKVQLAFPEYPDVVVANIADVTSGKPIFFEYPQTGSMAPSPTRPASPISPEGRAASRSNPSAAEHQGAAAGAGSRSRSHPCPQGPHPGPRCW